MKSKLSPKSSKLIDELIDAARRDGWESDQGSSLSAARAKEVLANARKDLERRLIGQEQQAKRTLHQLLQYVDGKWV